MKNNLILTSFAYLGLGVALTMNIIGMKSGLGVYTKHALFIIPIVFFIVVAFTSMQKLKDFIDKYDKK